MGEKNQTYKTCSMKLIARGWYFKKGDQTALVSSFRGFVMFLDLVIPCLFYFLGFTHFSGILNGFLMLLNKAKIVNEIFGNTSQLQKEEISLYWLENNEILPPHTPINKVGLALEVWYFTLDSHRRLFDLLKFSDIISSLM